MIVEALFIGLVIGFLFYEATGVSPGGVIAPGYFALFVLQPERMLATIVVALLVWGVLELLSSRLILFGRRRLLLALLLGFSIKLLIEQWVLPVSGLALELQAIGYMIPGLVGNEMARQDLIPTLAALGSVTILVYLILLLL
ncbi:MAG: poly-gamma-glutamate biosynthesis protein PgsC [Bacteroidota bacterium]